MPSVETSIAFGACSVKHAAPWAVQALHVVKKWQEESNLSAYFPRKDEGSLRTLTIRMGQTSGDKMVILTVSGRPEYALGKSQLETLGLW